MSLYTAARQQELADQRTAERDHHNALARARAQLDTRIANQRACVEAYLFRTFGDEVLDLRVGDPVLYGSWLQQNARITRDDSDVYAIHSVARMEFPVTRPGAEDRGHCFVVTEVPSYYYHDRFNTECGVEGHDNCTPSLAMLTPRTRVRHSIDLENLAPSARRIRKQHLPLSYATAVQFALLLEPEGDPKEYKGLTRVRAGDRARHVLSLFRR